MKAGLAVVLLSGGMDSCVTAAIADRSFELACLHVNYRQRTELRELRAFSEIASYYKVPEERRLVVDMGYLGEIGGSSLTDLSMAVPAPAVTAADEGGAVGIPTTYVPFRNTHLLAAAVSWGEVMGARKIFIGAVEDDRTGYPDCREQYYAAFNKLVDAGTRPETRITVEAPLIHMKKGDIVKVGMSLEAPFHLSWSCYAEEDVACGRCQSCVLRREAFSEAGHRDPIPYRSGGV